MGDYVIRKGDTLSRIAQNSGTTVSALADLNGIARDKVDRIYAGQSLKLRAAPPTMAAQVAGSQAPQSSFLDRMSSSVSTLFNPKTESKSKPLIQKTSYRAPTNPRAKAIQNRGVTTAPKESIGLMARSQQIAEAERPQPIATVDSSKSKALATESKFSKARSLLSSTPAKAGLTSMISSGVWTEDFLAPDELTLLREIAVKKIKRGQSGLTYSDYNRSGGSKVGYGMDIPDVARADEALKFTFGLGELVRDGKRVIAADEFDFGTADGIGDDSFMDKLSFVSDRVGRYLDGDETMKFYGLVHSVGEAFGPNPGQGPSMRANLGTAEELGITKAQFNKLPTLSQYKANNKSRIKQRPVRDFLRKIGLPLDNV